MNETFIKRFHCNFVLFVFLSDKMSGKLISACDYVLLYKVGLQLQEERLICKLKNMAEKKGARNWTLNETNKFCSLLADSADRFMITLERKALKKQFQKVASTKVVFQEVLEELKKRFQEERLKNLNGEALKKKKTSELQLDVKNLRVKYNSIKQQWRKLRDRQKHGSGLAPTKYPDWFEIIKPVLSDTNQTKDNNCSHPKDLSMITENDRTASASEYEETLSDLTTATKSY